MIAFFLYHTQQIRKVILQITTFFPYIRDYKSESETQASAIHQERYWMIDFHIQGQLISNDLKFSSLNSSSSFCSTHYSQATTSKVCFPKFFFPSTEKFSGLSLPDSTTSCKHNEKYFPSSLHPGSFNFSSLLDWRWSCRSPFFRMRRWG